MDRPVKQVLIWRNDVRNVHGHKVRTGKLAAQLAHASMAAILNIGKMIREYSDLDGSMIYTGYDIPLYLMQKEFNGKPDILLEPVQIWLEGTFTKVCVSVDSEEELMGKHAAARLLGMPCALITDNGLTEFNGVPTKTCCAIGPWWSDEIDQITGDLKLL